MPSSPPPYGIFDDENVEETKMGYSPTLRNFVNPKAPIPTETKDGAKTLWEVFDKSAKKFATKQCMGTRDLLKRDFVKTGEKMFEKVELSDYSYKTYAEVHKRAESLASGMMKEFDLHPKDTILIFAETQASWMTAALACWRQNIRVVTAYATLGPDGVISALNQTKATVCVCDARLVDIMKKCKDSCPKLKHLMIIPTKVDPDVATLQKSMGDGVKLVSLEELVSKGSTAMVAANACAPEDTAVVMYTSGTTGNAKGVIISHRSCVTCARSCTDFMPFMNSETVTLAYLPLAHIFELTVEFGAFVVGALIGYGSPQTLTDTGVKLNKGQKGDAPLLKPTAMIFAPAVLDKVYNGVMDKIRGTGCKECLFNRALASGYANFERGGVGATGCWDKIFKSSVQALIGGRVRNVIAGSAPLSAEIQKFVQTAFNAPARQGYGLTETCAASCVAHHTDNDLNQVGGPTPGCVIRLRDWPEGNYKNSDKDKADIKMRRGEVLIGGPMIADGYWIDERNPDPEIAAKNAEDWVEIAGVRYFCSGDIGAVTSKGQLKIVDRKKDLFKGAAGEYVSLSKVESLVKLSQYCEIPMAYGRTGAKGIIMLVVPKKIAVENFAKEKGLPLTNSNYPEVASKKEFVDMVSKSVLEECKKGGLASFECPLATGLCVAPDGLPAWTPDNDNLTTTMKLKRPTIAQNFAAVIDEAYKRA